jgi:hypothetical protein
MKSEKRAQSRHRFSELPGPHGLWGLDNGDGGFLSCCFGSAAKETLSKAFR